MNEYKLVSEEDNGQVVILRYEGNLYIPSDEDNRHWRKYMEYVDNGGLTDPKEVTE